MRWNAGADAGESLPLVVVLATCVEELCSTFEDVSVEWREGRDGRGRVDSCNERLAIS